MAREKRLQINRFEQQTTFYCGPACAQMFLALPEFSIVSPQQIAYNEIQKYNVEPNSWYSDPEGLSTYLSNILPDSFLKDVNDLSFSSDDFDEAVKNIYYTVCYLAIPCVTLVLSGRHWIIIDGIRFEEQQNGKREIIGIYIKDPWKGSPESSYISLFEFRQTKLLPNKVGNKWKDKYVILTKSPDQTLLVSGLKEIIFKDGGGGAVIPEQYAIQNMELQGFKNIETIKAGGVSVLSSVSVIGLDGASNYTIVPLDASKTIEFQDFVYVAIEEGSNNLLEISTISGALQIYNDQEMKQLLNEIFPRRDIQIQSGYFWKPCLQLRSRLAIARMFKIDDKDMFLLPDGTTSESLNDFSKGG